MAFFGVTVETISALNPIAGADRIERANLDGLAFEFVVPKGRHHIGERVLYFPIDSVIPQTVLEKLGLVGKLAGKDKNRLKTVRLRSQISQGLVAPLDMVADVANKSSEQITVELGVTKYEPPAVLVKGANLLPLPCGLSVYDIEGADRYTDVLETLRPQQVMITEKVEGQNFSVTCDGSRTLDVFVNQRCFTIQNLPDHAPHFFWTVAEKQGYIAAAKSLSLQYNKPVTIYGEMLGPGIQGNIYGLKEPKALCFDIRIGHDYLDPLNWTNRCIEFGLETVPVLASGMLDELLAGKSVVEFSNGKSKLADILREGIVIRPYVEQRHPRIGRTILKMRSLEYLVNEEG